MSNLSQETIDRIQKEASDMADKVEVKNDYQNGYKQGCEDGHIAGATEWAGKAQPVIDTLQHIYDCYADEWTEDNKQRVEQVLKQYKEVSK